MDEKDNHNDYACPNYNKCETRELRNGFLSHLENSEAFSEIKNFYGGSCIFITGATGFIGKALTEKLLRTCPCIEVIYLLIRSKRGKNAEMRCRELLQNPVFDRIRLERDADKIFSKVVSIEGDVTEEGLGISSEIRKQLQNHVTIVFHSAATVKFNETLSTAIALNTVGTQRVLSFCREIPNLKVMIHVSTAYSNADKEEISETVYPLSPDALNLVKNGIIPDEENLKNIALDLQGKHPNTYTITKAMAEWAVSEIADDIPAAIVRPSIVTAAWRDPYPGWVDNISGITGIMMEIGRGTIRSIICDQRLVVDIVPVDLVVNALISSAWHTHTHRPNAIKVYNCTSGTLNPLRWEELGAFTQKHALKTPSKYIQWYPGFTFRTNRFIHLLAEMAFHFLPAFIIDAILRICGSKPRMMKLYHRFKLAAKTGEFFALHQWNFANDNIRHLQREMRASLDRNLYTVDISKIDWEPYLRNYILGIRKYVLKDDLETIPFAKKKLQRLYWSHRILQIASVIFLFKIIRN